MKNFYQLLAETTKNNPIDVLKYLGSLNPLLAEKVIAIATAKANGTFVRADGDSCTQDNCHDHTGCSSTLANYDCECVDGVCTPIPGV